jgi:5-methylcytosine-specific restriction endonuclease McrA
MTPWDQIFRCNVQYQINEWITQNKYCSDCGNKADVVHHKHPEFANIIRIFSDYYGFDLDCYPNNYAYYVFDNKMVDLNYICEKFTMFHKIFANLISLCDKCHAIKHGWNLSIQI